MSGSASTERTAGLAATVAAKEAFSESALTTPILDRSYLTVPPAAVTAATAAEVSLPLLTTRYWVGAATAEPANAATRNASARFMDVCSFLSGSGCMQRLSPCCRGGGCLQWEPTNLQAFLIDAERRFPQNRKPPARFAAGRPATISNPGGRRRVPCDELRRLGHAFLQESARDGSGDRRVRAAEHEQTGLGTRIDQIAGPAELDHMERLLAADISLGQVGMGGDAS